MVAVKKKHCWHRIAVSILMLVGLILSAAGCAPLLREPPSDLANYRDPPPSSLRLRNLRSNERYIEGTLTAGGVECQALRTDDGILYTLTNLPPEFRHTRESVWIIGVGTKISYCMQGKTLGVKEIGLR